MSTGTVSRRVLARTMVARLLEQPERRVHWVQALAAYLVEHNRTDEVNLIVNDIAHELYEQRSELLVDVTSARPLTDQVRQALKQTLFEATKARSITLAEHVEQDLLGGLIADTPDARLDASVKNQLKQLAAIR